MSETTTAFLAGTAVAGVTALLFMKGGLSTQPMPVVGMQPTLPTASLSLPTTTAVSPQSYAGADPLTQSQTAILQSQLQQQQQMTEQLRNQLEQQKSLTDQLRNQFDQQRSQSDRVIAQIQDQQRSMDRMSLQQGLPLSPGMGVAPQSQDSTQTLVLWLAGGTALVLIVGGGAVLMVMVMLTQQSSSRRPSRPVNYAVPPGGYLPMGYPIEPPYPPAPPHRPAGYALPQRIRRIEQAPYYDDEY